MEKFSKIISDVLLWIMVNYRSAIIIWINNGSERNIL